MTRLDRVLTLLSKYDDLGVVALRLANNTEYHLYVLQFLEYLRTEKAQLTQELIEHGCRRKN